MNRKSSCVNLRPVPKSASTLAAEPRQNNVVDGMVGDHVAGRLFIDMQTERATAGFLDRRSHATFEAMQRIGVCQARRIRVVLCFSEAAVIPAHENLHLLPASSMRAENIKV